MQKKKTGGLCLPSFFHESKKMCRSLIQDKFVLEIQRENEILIVGVHGCWLTVVRIPPQLWNSFCLASGSVSKWEVWGEPERTVALHEAFVERSDGNTQLVVVKMSLAKSP